ncbi:hypothetical protein DPMN_086857 [Dreissena polymorpha]|uniref:Uncharacterized protein n=1 Tax=Dreissena polymorpha TaxID=45954 RepID=A0A9D4KR66_DREPO|nr:hypothetical protein DPMN_086857 [Dreissena polymorpha]
MSHNSKYYLKKVNKTKSAKHKSLEDFGFRPEPKKIKFSVRSDDGTLQEFSAEPVGKAVLPSASYHIDSPCTSSEQSTIEESHTESFNIDQGRPPCLDDLGVKVSLHYKQEQTWSRHSECLNKTV